MRPIAESAAMTSWRPALVAGVPLDILRVRRAGLLSWTSSRPPEQPSPMSLEDGRPVRHRARARELDGAATLPAARGASNTYRRGAPRASRLDRDRQRLRPALDRLRVAGLERQARGVERDADDR